MNAIEILEKYKQALETDGYKVLYIGLYGSQNYNLSDSLSDVDAKAIVLPKLEDVLFKKTVSNVRQFDTGAVDYKDLVTFYNVIKKGNFSFTEPFHTQYFIGDEYLRELFQKIPTNLFGIMGGMMEKRKALTHEYPSKTEEFAKWGCDPKQFHHILRLSDLFLSLQNEEVSANTPYLTYPDSDHADYLTALKRNPLYWTVDEMTTYADIRIDHIKTYLKNKNYGYTEMNYDVEIAEYLKIQFKSELLSEILEEK